MTSFDVMTPLMDWVENGKPVESLAAASNDEAAVAGKGRTLFPFPATSVLPKDGNPEDPAAWTKSQDVRVNDTLYKDWAGASFFKPGFQRFCAFKGLAFVCRP